MLTSPSCRCCGCLITDGDLDGVTCSGSWVRVGNQHYTETQNSIWYDPTPVSAVAWNVIGRFNIDIDLTSGSRLGSVTYRLIAALQNCDNYVFLELELHRPATGTQYYQLRLGYVEAGVEFIVTRHPHDITLCTAPPFAGEAIPSFVDLQLCWDGTTLTGSTSAIGTLTGGFKIASQAITLPGTKAGFAVGTFSSEVNRVTVSDFSLSLAETETGQEVCEDCPVTCNLGPAPPEIIIELGGTLTGTITTGTLVVCTIPCSELLGTYFLSLGDGTFIGPPTDPTSTPNRCVGDATCLWRFSGPIDAEWTCDGPYTVEAWVLITAEVFSNPDGSHRTLRVIVGVFEDDPSTSATCTPIIDWAVETDLPTDEWTDWLDLSPYGPNPPPACNDCDLSGLTVRAKKAA